MRIAFTFDVDFEFIDKYFREGIIVFFENLISGMISSDNTLIINDIQPTVEFLEAIDISDQIIEIGDLSKEDLFALYKYSSIVICSTIIECPGMSTQCLEALNIGDIPVIHSKSIGMKESLESVGLSFETADLNWFDFNDYLGLADRIEYVLADPKSHIEKQKHIISYYTKNDWKKTGKKYLELANIN
jgi:hypothetical protein